MWGEAREELGEEAVGLGTGAFLPPPPSSFDFP